MHKYEFAFTIEIKLRSFLSALISLAMAYTSNVMKRRVASHMLFEEGITSFFRPLLWPAYRHFSSLFRIIFSQRAMKCSLNADFWHDFVDE